VLFDASYTFVFQGNCFTQSGTSATPPNFSFSGACGIVNLVGNLNVDGFLDGVFHSDASSSGPGSSEGSVMANTALTYYVEASLLPGLVLGTDVPNVPVPILITASGQVTCSTTAIGTTQGVVTFNIGALSESASCLDGNATPNFSINKVSFNLSPNSSTQVQQSVLALADTGPCPAGSADCSASASATLDPVFEIDPLFQYASDYALIYSPNIQASTVPEPAIPLAAILVVMIRRKF
jgi:hypothetical protein